MRKQTVESIELLRMLKLKVRVVKNALSDEELSADEVYNLGKLQGLNEAITELCASHNMKEFDDERVILGAIYEYTGSTVKELALFEGSRYKANFWGALHMSLEGQADVGRGLESGLEVYYEHTEAFNRAWINNEWKLISI